MNEKKAGAPGTSTPLYQIVEENLNYGTKIVKNNDNSKDLTLNIKPDALYEKRKHIVQNVNEMMREQSKKPPVKALNDFWLEGDVCCCFAAPGVGKSLLAVQMGCVIALEKNLPILFADYELSDEQFYARYSKEGVCHVFPDGFRRVRIDPDRWDVDMTAEDIIDDLVITAVGCDTHIIIIDNISWLSDRLEKGEDAGKIMKKFLMLKQKGYSLLVIAHTPKRDTSQPLTLNDLYGSSKIGQFIDDCFAIARCADEKRRYIKQLKLRVGEERYGADNVIVCEITQKNNMVGFENKGFSTEKNCLGDVCVLKGKPTKEQAIISVLKLYPNANKSLFARALGVDHSYISRIFGRSQSQSDTNT